MTDVAIRAPAVHAVPEDYVIPGAQELLPKSVSASMDGTAAASAWFPCLQVLDPSGSVMFTAISPSIIAAGASADVSWFPHVGGGTGGGSVPLVGFDSFAPAAGFIQVTSTNEAAPTTIVTSSAFTADSSSYFIQFYVASVDIQVVGTGTGAALLMNLYRDSTDLGRVFDYNIPPNTGFYGSTNCFVSVLDTPGAGTHTYTMTAWRVQQGCTTTSFVYGSNIGPPFTGVTHPGYIAAYKVT